MTEMKVGCPTGVAQKPALEMVGAPMCLCPQRCEEAGRPAHHACEGIGCWASSASSMALART